MGKPKGSDKTGGRAEGTPNVVSGTVKQKFLDVFLDLQVSPQHSLRAWAMEDPKNLTEFYKLSSKLIPTEVDAVVKATVAGTLVIQEASK